MLILFAKCYMFVAGSIDNISIERERENICFLVDKQFLTWLLKWAPTFLTICKAKWHSANSTTLSI